MRSTKFNTLVSFRNLLEKQTRKDVRKPLKTAKEVMMLLNAILYDANSFEYFYTFGDNTGVYLITDDKNKIVKIEVGQ
jgi:hypothetical protein